jgi:cation transport ATPase
MRPVKLQSEIMLFTMLLTLTIFLVQNVMRAEATLSWWFLLSCAVSVTPGVLAGTAFARTVLLKLVNRRFFVAYAVLLSLTGSLLLGLPAILYLEPVLPLMDGLTVQLAFFISAFSSVAQWQQPQSKQTTDG